MRGKGQPTVRGYIKVVKEAISYSTKSAKGVCVCVFLTFVHLTDGVKPSGQIISKHMHFH